MDLSICTLGRPFGIQSRFIRPLDPGSKAEELAEGSTAVVRLDATERSDMKARCRAVYLREGLRRVAPVVESRSLLCDFFTE